MCNRTTFLPLISAWALSSLLILLSAPSTAFTQVDDSETRLALPLTGTWNGYQLQINILECSNFADRDLVIQLSMNSANNSELATVDETIPSQGTKHLILNDLTSIEDAYGSFSLDVASDDKDEAEQHLRCTSLFYRPDQSSQSKPFEYAFALPLREPSQGTQHGLYNSINPSGNPSSGTTEPVFNWLTIYNSDDTAFEAILELRDFSGASRSLRRIGPLAAGERIDIALGHDESFQNGQSVGLYRILPDNTTQKYLAFLSRYGSTDAVFNFAFSLQPSSGSCNLPPLFASTIGNARNWLEIANTSSETQSTTITVYDSLGRLQHTETFLLNPFGQRHIFLNQHLAPESVGSVRIACEENAQNALLAQSMFYGRKNSETENIRWAYGVQDSLSSSTTNTRLIGGSNTFFAAANWLRLLSVDAEAATARVRLFSSDAARTEERSLSLATNATSDLALHEFLGTDAIGTSSIESNGSAAGFVAETLRVFQSDTGAIEYILNTPTYVVPRAATELTLEPFVSGLNGPVYLTHSGDSTGRLFVVERAGRVRVIENDELLPTPFLDISTLVGLSGEQGLHSIVFHPEYASNGLFFVHYNNKDGDTQVVRYARDNSNMNLADPSSAKLIYELEQPDHFFGQDSFLYIALGDGGFAGDPLNYGQNTSNTFGTVLRINVDVGDPYSIPSDNPFVDNNDIPSEIFATGFRNPWRFSFDRLDGRLFLGDVGQNDVEEIDLVESGKNYGWSTMEGSRCFKPTTNCDTTGLTLPISEYTHAEGNSVIGGYVYRGEELTEIQGKYLFSDFSSGRIWALTQNEDETWRRDQVYESESDIFVVSFGEDEAGELYIIEITGAISKIVIKN